jgi:hypothetical protein
VHLAQPIDSPGISGKTGKNLITNKVTAICHDRPDKPIDCTMHALPTTVSRLNTTHNNPDIPLITVIIALIYPVMQSQIKAYKISQKKTRSKARFFLRN